jgi:hypothetical protein
LQRFTSTFPTPNHQARASGKVEANIRAREAAAEVQEEGGLRSKGPSQNKLDNFMGTEEADEWIRN